MVNYILNLLEADDMINEPDKDGNTPLHLAVMNFHSRVVRDLVKTNEVDIGAINNDGKTALEIAQVRNIPIMCYTNFCSWLSSLFT